jgi:transposase
MAKLKSWEVSDALWAKVEPLIPVKQRDPKKKYKRTVGGGAKPLESRKVFAGILYVLRTGCQWKAVPKEKYGCGSAVHRYFTEWAAHKFFETLWKAGLMEYDELKGIAWEWQSADGAMNKAPLAQEKVGKNPTDRGKKRREAQHPRG